MQKLAARIAENVARSSGMDEERQKVIAYGLGALIQMISLLAASVVFGFLFHCLIESMIIFWVVGIFKSSAGGAHARTSSSCTYISLGSIFIMSLIARYAVPASPAFLWAYMAVVIIVFAVAFFAVYRLAPVASANKPITRTGKIKRLRMQAFITCGAFMAISVLLVALCNSYPRCINAAMSLCLAVLWQSFMLTPPADRFIGMFDSAE